MGIDGIFSSHSSSSSSGPHGCHSYTASSMTPSITLWVSASVMRRDTAHGPPRQSIRMDRAKLREALLTGLGEDTILWGKQVVQVGPRIVVVVYHYS